MMKKTLFLFLLLLNGCFNIGKEYPVISLNVSDAQFPNVLFNNIFVTVVDYPLEEISEINAENAKKDSQLQQRYFLLLSNQTSSQYGKREKVYREALRLYNKRNKTAYDVLFNGTTYEEWPKGSGVSTSSFKGYFLDIGEIP